jgi:hypothetical protein
LLSLAVLSEEFPEVPEKLRPKKLPHMGLTSDDQKKLEEKGWILVDVRLIGEDSDGDRAEAVKLFLEGIRLGSIAPDSTILRFLELEAKVYGLTAGKASATKSGPLSTTEEGSLAEILGSFGADKPWSAKADEKAQKTKRALGAPKKNKNAVRNKNDC